MTCKQNNKDPRIAHRTSVPEAALSDWRKIFDAFGSAVLILDDGMRIVRCNRAAAELMGLTANEVVGRHCHEVIHGTTNPVDECPTARMLKSAKRETGEQRIGDRWYKTVSDPIFGKNGRIVGSVHILEDVSDRYSAEEECTRLRNELMHASRMNSMGQLTAALSHELNQPLTAILSNAQAAHRLLSRSDVDLGGIREILSDIVEDTVRAGEIIRRIRAFGRRSKQKFELLDINEVVEDTLCLVRSELLMRKVILETASDPCRPRVMGDRVQLQQVLINLIANGMEALGGMERRELSVTTVCDGGGQVVVRVKDSGPGIGDEDMKQIFASFYSTKDSGMGMGLTISRSIIRSHGGDLWAENHPEGGAVFSFILPLAEQKE